MGFAVTPRLRTALLLRNARLPDDGFRALDTELPADGVCECGASCHRVGGAVVG
jgi:hypothetical protein